MGYHGRLFQKLLKPLQLACGALIKTGPSWANGLKKHFFASILEQNKQTNQLFLYVQLRVQIIVI